MISTHIRRQSNQWGGGLWFKFYRYRWLIYALVARDLKLRYRGSVLGFFWTLLNPLIFMAVYTLIFSIYFRVGMEHYPIFLLSGLLPWIWFSNAIQQGTTSIIDSSSFIGRTIFPSEILPIVPILSNMVAFLLSLPLLLIFLVIFQIDLGWPLLTLPLIMLPQLLLSLGLVLFLSAYTVFFRDIKYLIGHVLTILFFLVPIMYPLSQIPEKFRFLVKLNPLTILMQSYQGIFFFHTFPDWPPLFFLTAFGFSCCWVGKKAFERYKDSFAEYI